MRQCNMILTSCNIENDKYKDAHKFSFGLMQPTWYSTAAEAIRDYDKSGCLIRKIIADLHINENKFNRYIKYHATVFIFYNNSVHMIDIKNGPNGFHIKDDSHEIDIDASKFVYIAKKGDIYTIRGHKACSDGLISGDLDAYYVVSADHIGGPEYVYLDWGNSGDPSVDLEANKAPDDPTACYQHYMRFISFEQHFKVGPKEIVQWVMGHRKCNKSFSDFMDPVFYQNMRNFKYPVIYTKDRSYTG